MKPKHRKSIGSERLRYMIMLAMFIALAYATTALLRIKVQHLTLDAKDAVITLCGLIMGPVASLIVSVVVPVLETLTVGGDTMGYGLIMNILSSATLSVTAAIFYKYSKTLFSAVVGLFSGIAMLVAVMTVANYFLTPYYLANVVGVPFEAALITARSSILPLVLPFNLLKGAISVGIVLLLYKRLSIVLHKLGVLRIKELEAPCAAPHTETPVADGAEVSDPEAIAAEKADADTENAEDRKVCENPTLEVPAKKKHTSLWVTIGSIALIVASLVLFFTVMGADLSSGEEGGTLSTIISAMETFLVEHLGREWGVIICSMLPVIELRGAIPLGMGLGLEWWQCYLFAVLGNMLPVPFILLFINRVIAWMEKSRIKFLHKVAAWIMRKAEKNRAKVEKYSFWGVCLFVAIPLPMTGAWTGSLVAAVIDMKFWKALLSAFIGVLVAGAVVTAIAYGGLAAFQWLL